MIATAAEARTAAVAEAIAIAVIRVMSLGPGVCAVGYHTRCLRLATTIVSDDPNDRRLRCAITATIALGSVITAFRASGRTTCRRGRAVFVRGCRPATRTRDVRMNNLPEHAANTSDLVTVKLTTDVVVAIHDRIMVNGLLVMLGRADWSSVYRVLAILALMDWSDERGVLTTLASIDESDRLTMLAPVD